MSKKILHYIDAAEKIISHILSKQNNPLLNVDGRNGGYLTILDTQGLVEYSILIGDPNYNKANKYLDLSIEKARRLFQNIDGGHKTSFESKNEEEDKYAGAIHMYTPVLSFSGFTSLIDEAICFSIKIILCSSSFRSHLNKEILEIYNKRENKDGLNIYSEIQKNFLDIWYSLETKSEH